MNPEAMFWIFVLGMYVGCKLCEAYHRGVERHTSEVLHEEREMREAEERARSVSRLR